MQRVSIDEVYPLFHSCFPEVKKSSLEACNQWMHFYMYGNDAFCCIYPCKYGLVLEYIGVAINKRGAGLCKKVMSEIKSMYPGLDIYSECIPGSKLYWILLRNGWKRVPINYAYPAWGDEPADDSYDLLVLSHGKEPVDILGFLTEYYTLGFNSDVDALMRRYRRELDRW